jgi:lysophospholipase L1-like esterase
MEDKLGTTRTPIILLMGLCILTGCSGDPSPSQEGPVQPASGSMAGYYEITLDPTSLGLAPEAIDRVTVGGVAAYSLVAQDDGLLRLTIQGHPQPGEAEIIVHSGEESYVLESPFRYNPPLSAHFDRFVAIGASLTQGVQRGTPSYHGALMSPSAQIARQARAYHPLPLLKPGLFPQVDVEDIGDPPICAIPNVVSFVVASFAEILPKLSDPETDVPGYQFARIDPDITVYNIAVGSSMVSATLHGPGDDIGASFLGHLVYEPYGAFLSPVEQSQMDVLESLEPTLVISTDLLGNDIIWGIVAEDEINPDLSTSLEEIHADLILLLDRLAATGAQAFLATLPRPSMLPVTETKRAQMLADGFTDVDERIDAIDALATAANALLVEESARHDNIHVVEIAARVLELETTGLQVGDEILTTHLFGGLLGLDGIHFTDTGYGLLANGFIEAINDTLGTDIPFVDLVEILAHDPESPTAIQEKGLDPSQCE